MNENPQTEHSVKIVPNKDEISLIDILLIMWNWKYLILTGTLICALVAVFINIILPDVYSVEMVLQPGVLSVREDGSNIYIDSGENIKAIIEAGTFNNKLLRKNIKAQNDELLQSLKFEVSIPESSNIIKISYDTSDRDQGIIILSDMFKLLLERYGKIVEYYQKDYEKKIDSKKIEIKKAKASKQNYENSVNNIDKRINEFKSDLKILSNETQNLIQEENRFLDTNAEERDSLSALLYSNTIQQNLTLANIYKTEISENELKKERELSKSQESENKLLIIANEIDKLELKKNSVQNVQILRYPTSSPFPTKPNKHLNVVMASTAGLFLTVFLALFLEYIKNNKGREQPQNIYSKT